MLRCLDMLHPLTSRHTTPPLFFLQAIMMVKPEHLNQLLHPQFKDPADSPLYKAHVLTKGLPASPGAAVGKVRLYCPYLAPI